MQTEQNIQNNKTTKQQNNKTTKQQNIQNIQSCAHHSQLRRCTTTRATAMGKKKGKSLNPADQFRKQQRKRVRHM